MFGYIVCNKSELSKEEHQRYQKIYCSLCRELKQKYGQIARFSLNYDFTFLALYLSALYEPEESETQFRCMIHPFETRSEVRNPFIEYAADMTILLTYFKCLDDWNDEKKAGRLWYSGTLKKHLDNLEQKYPRQYRVIKTKIERMNELENKTINVSDEIVNCCGDLMAELFVYNESDYWSPRLRMFGYELGRFIYLMDAIIDYEDDLKSGNYNPFIKMEFDRDRAKEILNVMIGNAMEHFESLPIVKDVNILKNILYGGIWSQYNMKTAGKDM